LFELRFRHGDGYWCYLEAIGNNLLDEPSVGGIGSTSETLVERKRAAERLRHNAFHDPLTDLPNRTLFMDRLEQAVQHAGTRITCLLYSSWILIKIVNDSLGHMSGDQLLLASLAGWRGAYRRYNRALGDEFAILLNRIEDVNYATSIAERIKQELARLST